MFINQHNHALSPKIQEFATKYQSFTDEALHEISLMTKHGNLSLTVQRSLLKARFPDLHFQNQDLANAIQKYKKSDKINNDASVLLTSLMQKKLKTYVRRATNQAPIIIFTDADPMLDAAIPIVFPETYPAYCIFHISQNLPKNLKAKLGKKCENFIQQFYYCRNSLCEPLFKQRWNQLLTDFPMTKDYLLLEGYNWIIKQQLKANSTLCELADHLDSRLIEEGR
ncbi:7459_t:CDS:2 [Cetraspora pellucida]|uniref:7459_t:CDS:1 n=1 Tax=Cetraspora pellucida TaxID=1433469 RepID=A0A9N9NFU3_9GLOM|nr:7459_t:CDS:2 [Cetraspora pellucida]